MTRALPLWAALVMLPTVASPCRAEEPEALQASPPGCISAQSSASEKHAAAGHVLAQMMGPVAGAAPMPATPVMHFAPDLFPLAQQNIFGNLWARCGLSRHDRSLVTLGILIALRADNELRYHFPIAMRNGISRSELEEVVYQATGYAGFPAGASAARIADETLPKP